MNHSLTPKLLWDHFAKMSAIPRGSKREEKIRAFYREYATERGFEWEEDEIGNILIKKPATEGFEDAPTVILQGHIDMVWQKGDESTHNFEEEGITLIYEDGWVRADDTTLGADNGIGVAAAIAILEDESAEHGPLEVLLTVDEEAGMGGVRALSPDWLSGDYLLNLDSERFGSCCVGSAGGIDLTYQKEYLFDQTPCGEYFRVSLSGLRGGHSGLDIHRGYGNATLLLTEILHDFSHQYPLRIASLEGGTLRNAIPRAAEALIAVDASHKASFIAHLQEWESRLFERLKSVEEGVELQYEEGEPIEALDPIRSRELLNSLMLMPNGVIRHSATLPVVESSANVGIVTFDQSRGVEVSILARSLNRDGLAEIIAKLRSVTELTAGFMEASGEYPGWNPNLSARPLKALRATYQELFGEEMQVEVLHAGLETGFILERYPHLEMVSFGPTIRGAHSPKERVDVATVEKFYTLLKALLKSLK